MLGTGRAPAARDHPRLAARLNADDEGADRPDDYRGVIIIEWPAAHGASPYSAIAGRMVEITDALTGKPIRTCTGVTVHADMDRLVTADLTMFADEGGLPLFDGEPVRDGDGFRTGVFPFLVSEMRVRER